VARVRSVCGHLLRLYFKDREFWRLLGDNDLGGGGIWWGKLAHYIQHPVWVWFWESIGLL